MLYSECFYHPEIHMLKFLPTKVMMILGSVASGRWLGHEGGALVHGITVIKNIAQSSLAPPSTWGYDEKSAARKGALTKRDVQAPWCWASQPPKTPPVCDILL